MPATKYRLRLLPAGPWLRLDLRSFLAEEYCKARSCLCRNLETIDLSRSPDSCKLFGLLLDNKFLVLVGEIGIGQMPSRAEDEEKLVLESL